MEFLSSTLLSGMLYDGFRKGVDITNNFLREKLQGWLIDDELLTKLTKQVNALDLQNYGERIIEKKLTESPELQEILTHIRPDQNTNIGSVSQSHSGSGDNVVGNKTVYHK